MTVTAATASCWGPHLHQATTERSCRCRPHAPGLLPSPQVSWAPRSGLAVQVSGKNITATPALATLVGDTLARGLSLPASAVTTLWSLNNSHCFPEAPSPGRCVLARLLRPQHAWVSCAAVRADSTLWQLGAVLPGTARCLACVKAESPSLCRHTHNLLCVQEAADDRQPAQHKGS